jgi:metal-dependent amidase/aminoacylase/carboxypeptidase family protein
MENLKQGVAPLILLRKELHKYPKSGKEVGTQKITSFLEKYPADEIITNIGETGIIAIYNGENQENNLV